MYMIVLRNASQIYACTHPNPQFMVMVETSTFGIFLGLNVRSPFNVLHSFYIYQWHSQNSEKVTHIKGDYWNKKRFSSVAPLFKIGTSLKGKKLLPEGAGSKFFPLRAVPYGMENHFDHIR